MLYIHPLQTNTNRTGANKDDLMSLTPQVYNCFDHRGQGGQ